MATVNQIEFILKVKEKIQEPILIIGSRMYDYDAMNIEVVLRELGFVDITGVDILEGEGVHVMADACDVSHPFFTGHRGHFRTVFCMEVLTNVKFPWLVGENVRNVADDGAHVVISEVFVRKLSRMPKDYWRFTYDGFSVIYDGFELIDELAMRSLVRAKVPDLVPLNGNIFEVMHERASGEHTLGCHLRRVHRKFFGGKLFRVSRLLPEQTVYAVGRKKNVASIE